MKFFIDNWFLFFTAAVSGALLVWPLLRGGAGGGGAKVTATQAVTLINREKATLIDVSEPDEYAKGHAVGARNVPFGTLETSSDLPKNKTLPVVLVCPTGARAGRAAGILKKRGFDNTHVLAGGLASWREANLPVEKAQA